MRKIYYNNLVIHTYIKGIIKNPPSGYKFIINTNYTKKGVLDILKKNKTFVTFYKSFVKRFFNVFRIINNLYYDKSPEYVDIIFSTGIMVNEKKPWIMNILDTPFCMGGNDYNVFIDNLDEIEESLLSSYCKKIIVHTNLTKKYMKKYFSNKVLKKVILLRPAIPKIVFKGEKPQNIITFLFMGSINNPNEFLMKGGIEALKTFKILENKYENIRLIVRCRVDIKIKEKYKSKNIMFLEKELSNRELIELYKKTNILLMPAYGGYFVMAYLEAFSYGIPIIALDTYGVSEFIQNNFNGFCISVDDPLLKERSYPTNIRIKKLSDIKTIDKEIINKLVEKSTLLIENRELRNNMSLNCLKLSKTKFSFRDMNKGLKRILDESLKH